MLILLMVTSTFTPKEKATFENVVELCRKQDQLLGVYEALLHMKQAEIDSLEILIIAYHEQFLRYSHLATYGISDYGQYYRMLAFANSVKTR